VTTRRPLPRLKPIKPLHLVRGIRPKFRVYVSRRVENTMSSSDETGAYSLPLWAIACGTSFVVRGVGGGL
jgi:hypothetical protein